MDLHITHRNIAVFMKKQNILSVIIKPQLESFTWALYSDVINGIRVFVNKKSVVNITIKMDIKRMLTLLCPDY